MRYDITSLYCLLDDFCKVYQEWERYKLIETDRKRHRKGMLSLAEMLTIMVCFHLDSFKNFKYYYLYGVCMRQRGDFKQLPCYARFVQCMPRLFVPLALLMHWLSGEQTGIYFVDSTKLPICHNKRIRQNRVFEGLAARGKSSMGWFYGFKLHMIINHKGEIMAVRISRGNMDDRTPLDAMTRALKGVLCGDKGYIDQNRFKALYARGLKLITGIRKNMKNILMPITDKLLLRKRSIVETIFEILKHDMNIDHTRHRSPINAFVNILAALAAYSYRKNKPAIGKLELQLIHN